MLYPYDSPFILTDSVFLMYGGSTGTSTVAQRQASYLLAEEQMTEHLSAFLKPTIVTGSLERHRTYWETEYGYVHNIFLVSQTEIEQVNPLILQTHTGSAIIADSRYGLLQVFTPCNFSDSAVAVYESGLPTGIAAHPSMLQALTIAAQINLNEMDISLSNESTADIGVQSYANQSYSEMRKPLLRTIFGNSAMAQRAAMLVKKLRAKSATGFR